jgi:predicted phosphoadenosine phosphosulfate sulfurtransferase
MTKENIMVSFSGGRTSAFMCHWLIENMSHLYNLHFTKDILCRI